MWVAHGCADFLMEPLEADKWRNGNHCRAMPRAGVHSAPFFNKQPDFAASQVENGFGLRRFPGVTMHREDCLPPFRDHKSSTGTKLVVKYCEVL